MDGLSAAASVIAVIQISSQVIAQCAQYYKGVRDAKEEISRLQQTVESNRDVLQGIKQLLERSDAEKQLSVSKQLSAPLAKCEASLKVVSSELEPEKKRKAMRTLGLRALKWPFKSEQLTKIITDLERSTQTFSAALQVDQTKILLGFEQTMKANRRRLELDTLPTVPNAGHDTHDEEYNAKCLENTRVEIIQQIKDWATALNSERMFWLNGVAGTGKSTIARTVAEISANRGILGASFFFKRGTGDRSSATRFFTTIAWQLALRFPVIADCIADAICKDPDIATKGFREQFEKLVLRPLSMLPVTDLPVVLFVVDALDECEQSEDIQMIIRLFTLSEGSRPIQLRIFLTSRPELPLRLEFRKLTTATYTDIILHKIDSQIVEHDIKLFLEHEFSDIREVYELNGDWPGDTAIDELACLANPLFIFAATVCRYVRDGSNPPRQQLDYFLGSARASEASGMDKTYFPILNQLLLGKPDAIQSKIKQNFLQVVGVVVLLASPLSIRSLSALLGLDEEDVSFRLRHVHSVLNIPTDRSSPIRLIHLSFRDYLTDQENKDKNWFWVDENQTHKKIADHCLALLMSTSCLRQDICNKRRPGIKREKFTKAEVDRAITSETQYACRYWVFHLQSSIVVETEELEIQQILSFLQAKFLHWLEALSLIGYPEESIYMLQKLQSIPQIQAHDDVGRFVQDAKRFALQNREIIEKFPLQIYSSALVFSPLNSIVRKVYQAQIPHWILQAPKVQPTWSPCLLTLEGHSSRVSAISFSPDGQTLTSGDGMEVLSEGFINQKVISWNVATGSPRSTFERYSSLPTMIAISPDGQTAALSTNNTMVEIRDATTGLLRSMLKGHTNLVTLIVFSPDGQMLASGTIDNTLQVWDVVTGSTRSIRKYFPSHLRSIAFSPDGKSLAVACGDRHISLHDVATESLSTISRFDSGWVNAMAFLPDGHTLVSGCNDNTIKLWNMATDSLRTTCEVDIRRIDVIAVSPDGQTVALGSGLWSDNMAVKLWDLASESLRGTFEGHLDAVKAVAFSPDGRTLASASHDNTVKLWDVTMATLPCSTSEVDRSVVTGMAFSPNMQTVALVMGNNLIELWDLNTRPFHRRILEEHTNVVMDVAFSPDGKTVASASWDGTVKLWDTTVGSPAFKSHSGHTRTVITVSFSPDGKMLASGAGEGEILFWDITKVLSLRSTVLECDAAMITITFSPNGQVLMSGHFDNTVRLWDTATLQQLEIIKADSVIRELRFAPDGVTWLTDRGIHQSDYLLRKSSMPASAVFHGIFIAESWICMGNQRILWLPRGYRPISKAVQGSRVVLGRQLGLISIIELDIEALKKELQCQGEDGVEDDIPRLSIV